jgi:hypothetical protein
MNFLKAALLIFFVAIATHAQAVGEWPTLAPVRL